MPKELNKGTKNSNCKMGASCKPKNLRIIQAELTVCRPKGGSHSMKKLNTSPWAVILMWKREFLLPF